nr:hypothetical protein [Glycomyces harbinensis]
MAQRTESHRQLGLLGHRRRNPETSMKPRSHQRHPTGTTDQQQRGQLRGLDPGTLKRPAGLIHRARHQRVGEARELVAGQVQAHRVVAGQCDRRGRGPREHLLGRTNLTPERQPITQIRGRLRLGQAPPQLQVAPGHNPPQMRGQRHIDIETAQIVQAPDRERPQPPVLSPTHHRRIERPPTEVENRNRTTHRDLLTQDLRAVRRGRDRLGQEADPGQGRDLRGALEDRAAHRTPVRRIGQHRLSRAQPRSGGLVGDPPQARGKQLLHRNLPVTEQDRALVDAPLGMRLEPLRLGSGQTLGVAAGVEVPAGVEEHPGRQQRRTVEEQRTRLLTVTTDNSNGMGGAEIDGKPNRGLHDVLLTQCRTKEKP